MSPVTKQKACHRQSDFESMACAKVGQAIKLLAYKCHQVSMQVIQVATQAK